MPRAGPATPPDDGNALVEQRAGDLADVLGGRRVHEAPADLRGAAGVGARHHGHPAGRGDRRDEPDHAEHLRRPLTAVHADHVDPPAEQPGGNGLGRVPEQRAVVSGERGARDEGEAGSGVSSCRDRLLELPQIGLRLDHQHVDPCLDERAGLLPIRVEGLLGADPAVGLQPNPEGPDRPTDQLGAGIPREPRTGGAEVRDPVGEAVVLEAGPVRAERVGQQQLRAGVDERPMDRRDPFGRVDVERFHAGLDGNPRVDQRCPHASVRDQRSGEASAERGGVHPDQSPSGR
jgi:hypothetical protein